MASLDGIRVRKFLASGKVVQRADDASIALRVRYIGAAGTPSVVMTSATKVAMTDATAAVDYTWANYATMGALADAINASGLWEVKLLDCLRADVTLNSFKANTTVTPGTDENGVTVWDFVHDNTIVTNGIYVASVCLSPFMNFDAPKGHRVHVREIDYCQNVGTAAADSVQLYKRLGNGTETKIFGTLSVDSTGTATVTSISWASGKGKISGGDNEEFILRVKDAGSLTTAAGSMVQLVGTIE
jgi:hypothetical protein